MPPEMWAKVPREARNDVVVAPMIRGHRLRLTAPLLALLALLSHSVVAGAGLLDPGALRQRLIAEAVRYAERFAPPRSPQPPAWAQRADPPLATVALLADLHYDDSGRAAWTKPTRDRLLKATKYLNDTVKPKAVLLLGDLVAFEDPEQLRHVKALLDTHLKAPYHAVAGNHDGPDFEKVFGPSNYSVAIAGVRFVAIGLKTAHWDSGWGIYDRLDWLTDELAAHRAEPTLLFAHNPIILPTFSNNAEILKLLEGQPQALAYLAGHLHVDYDMRPTKVHLGVPMLARPPHAFKALRIHPDRILVFTHEEADGAYRQANIYQKIDIPDAYRLKPAAQPPEQ